jgi:hypothetical protein
MAYKAYVQLLNQQAMINCTQQKVIFGMLLWISQ